MTSQSERLEQILGGKLERHDARVVPGTVAIEGKEVVYFADDGRNQVRKQFNALTSMVERRQAKSGGRTSQACKITLPDGQIFHAMSYHGDLEGWRKDIEAGAQALQLLLARIEGDTFAISDGRSFPLRDCKIEFD